MWLERLRARLESLGARHYTVGKARRWSLVYMIRKARSLTLYGSKGSEVGSKGSELSNTRLERFASSLASYGFKSSELSIIWPERLGA